MDKVAHLNLGTSKSSDLAFAFSRHVFMSRILHNMHNCTYRKMPTWSRIPVYQIMNIYKIDDD